MEAVDSDIDWQGDRKDQIRGADKNAEVACTASTRRGARGDEHSQEDNGDISRRSSDSGGSLKANGPCRFRGGGEDGDGGGDGGGGD